MTTAPTPLNLVKHVEDYLMHLNHYVNRPGFTSGIGWTRMDNADVLVDKTTKRIAVLIVVGKVNSTKMRCGPAGTFAGEITYGTFDKAKFQFSISRPDEPIMAKEYDKALKIMSLLQKDVAKTDKHEHFIIDKGDMKFSQGIFEKRDRPIDNVPRFAPKGNYAVDGAVLLESLVSTTPPADALDSDGSTGTMEDPDDDSQLDETTRTYAKYIPQSLQKKYHDLIGEHAVTPLRLFTRDGAYITPDNTESVLPGALVEAHFTFKHYWFRGGNNSDTFTAGLEQTIWLKAGIPRLVDGGYNKRRNPFDGPTQPPINKAFKTVAGASASMSPASTNVPSNVTKKSSSVVPAVASTQAVLPASGSAVVPEVSGPIGEKTPTTEVSKSSEPLVAPTEVGSTSDVVMGPKEPEGGLTMQEPERRVEEAAADGNTSSQPVVSPGTPKDLPAAGQERVSSVAADGASGTAAATTLVELTDPTVGATTAGVEPSVPKALAPPLVEVTAGSSTAAVKPKAAASEKKQRPLRGRPAE
ncbi:hypothetical protein HWV62_43766 [Athelia sp. TMB]|nr:hypothetical protein HWV62_43766 [Athelia sp. TMB]